VQVRVETSGVVDAASYLRGQADAARGLAARAASLGAGVSDPIVGEALATLGDVCGDVLQVVGLDLVLLASACQAGAARYESVETAVAGAAQGLPR
jgi:hypothetical protein